MSIARREPPPERARRARECRSRSPRPRVRCQRARWSGLRVREPPTPWWRGDRYRTRAPARDRARFAGVARLVRFPGRAHRDAGGEAEGDEMLLPLVAPCVTHQIGSARRPSGFDPRAPPPRRALFGEGRHQREATSAGSRSERGLVALLDPLGAELEQQRSRLIGFALGDVDEHLRIARFGGAHGVEYASLERTQKRETCVAREPGPLGLRRGPSR